MSNSQPDLLLKDQVALIVGAGRAPGPLLARALAAQGACIAANDLSPILLDPLAEAVEAQGGRIRIYVADATRGMPLRAMLDEVLEDWGRIDILINNPRIQPDKPFLEIDEYDWQRTVEVNLNGTFLITQQVARLMQEQGQGVIINLVETNQAALEQPGHAAYAASQAGLLALTKAAARELIAYNIRVHILPCVQPVCQDLDASPQALLSTLAQQAISFCSAGRSGSTAASDQLEE